MERLIENLLDKRIERSFEDLMEYILDQEIDNFVGTKYFTILFIFPTKE